MSEQSGGDLFSQLAGSPMLAVQIGIYVEKYSNMMIVQSIANERAAIIKELQTRAGEHAEIEDDTGMNRVMSSAYSDAADLVRNRG